MTKQWTHGKQMELKGYQTMNDQVILSSAQWMCVSGFIKDMAKLADVESNIDQQTLDSILKYCLELERKNILNDLRSV